MMVGFKISQIIIGGVHYEPTYIYSRHDSVWFRSRYYLYVSTLKIAL